RGGRLPTAAELARASHADVENVTKVAAFEAMKTCWLAEAEDEEAAECDYVRRRAYVEMNPQPIRSEEDDVGPFGHWDLFGARCDFTQSTFPGSMEIATYCALEDGDPDPRTFGSGGVAS